jgi:transmembrane sensor
MNSGRHIIIDDTLLGKYLAGEALPEEALALEKWLQASAENRKLFEESQTVWQKTGRVREVFLPDLLKMQSTGSADNQKRLVKRIFFSRRNFQVAAAILLFVLAGSILLLLFVPGKKMVGKPDYIIKTAGDTVLQDTLPDRSAITLAQHATLKYPVDFNDRKREVTLTGEGWFHVAANPDKPFIISAGNVFIRVTGTSFSVRQTDTLIETCVKTGTVMMYNGQGRVKITAGHKGIYSVIENKFSLADSFNINAIGFATGIFTFENASMKEIAGQLEKAYGITIVFENEKLKDCTISCSFDNKPINYIFDVIAVTLNIRWYIRNKTVYINGSGCN